MVLEEEDRLLDPGRRRVLENELRVLGCIDCTHIGWEATDASWLMSTLDELGRIDDFGCTKLIARGFLH